jgi:hypothetical protein
MSLPHYVFTTQLAVWDPPTMGYDCHTAILTDPWRNLDIAMNEFREHMIESPRGNDSTVVSGVRTVAPQEVRGRKNQAAQWQRFAFSEH